MIYASPKLETTYNTSFEDVFCTIMEQDFLIFNHCIDSLNEASGNNSSKEKLSKRIMESFKKFINKLMEALKTVAQKITIFIRGNYPRVKRMCKFAARYHWHISEVEFTAINQDYNMIGEFKYFLDSCESKTNYSKINKNSVEEARNCMLACAIGKEGESVNIDEFKKSFNEIYSSDYNLDSADQVEWLANRIVDHSKLIQNIKLVESNLHERVENKRTFYDYIEYEDDDSDEGAKRFATFIQALQSAITIYSKEMVNLIRKSTISHIKVLERVCKNIRTQLKKKGEYNDEVLEDFEECFEDAVEMDET